MRLLLLLLALAMPLMADPAPPSTAWREVIQPGEPLQFVEAVKLITAQMQEHARRSDGTIRRGFHAKSHAALSAEFRTLADLPAWARVGIFREARTYPAYVRFSNGIGSVERDRKPDVRGIALKVIGSEGPKLAPGEESAKTQDFLAINTPMVVARDTRQFLAFAKASMSTLKFLPTLIQELGFREATRIAGYAATRLVRQVRTLAGETYWSGAVIQYGPYAAKFMLRPAAATTAKGHLLGPKDYLRDEFAARLAQGDVRFDFYVQFFVDEQRTPIEDASVEWLPEHAPWLKVGELVIRRRDLASPRAQAEEAYANDLSYSPWHCTADFRPLGNIQRSRLAVYQASARYRGRKNAEPDGSEKFE